MYLRLTEQLKFSITALIIGIASGLLTGAAARFSSELNPFIAVFFAAAVLFLLWLEHKKGSGWLVAALLASSVAAYCAAIWGTLLITGTIESISRNSHLTDPFGPVMFAIAGFLGALVFDLAVLLLCSPRRGLSILGRAAGWALAGTALGFISSDLTDSLGLVVKALIGVPRTDMGSNDYYMSLYSAYLIWQTGMVLLIPRMLPRATVSQPEGGALLLRSPLGLSWAGKLFFGVIFAVSVFFSYSVTISAYRSWQHQRSVRSQTKVDLEGRTVANSEQRRKRKEQMALSVAEAPPGFETLRTTKRLTESVLILSKIGIYYPRTFSAMERSPFKNSEPDEYVFPSRVNYSVSYEGASAEDGSSSQRLVSVMIAQYPNNDWARYELRNTPEPNMSVWHPPTEQLAKFKNQVLRYRVLRYPPAYYWTSGDKNIIVYCGPEDEVVLEQYLLKYPSSLGRLTAKKE